MLTPDSRPKIPYHNCFDFFIFWSHRPQPNAGLLLTEADWDKAAHAYAAEHDRYFGSIHRLPAWLKAAGAGYSRVRS